MPKQNCSRRLAIRLGTMTVIRLLKVLIQVVQRSTQENY